MRTVKSVLQNDIESFMARIDEAATDCRAVAYTREQSNSSEANAVVFALLDELEDMAASQQTVFSSRFKKAMNDTGGQNMLPDTVSLVRQAQDCGRLMEAMWWLASIRSLKMQILNVVHNIPNAASDSEAKT